MRIFQREALMLNCKIVLFHKQPIIHWNSNFLIIFDANGKEMRIYLRMKFWWLVLKTRLSGEIIGIEMFEEDLNLNQFSFAHPISNQFCKTKYSSFSPSAHNFLSLLAAQRSLCKFFQMNKFRIIRFLWFGNVANSHFVRWKL